MKQLELQREKLREQISDERRKTEELISQEKVQTEQLRIDAEKQLREAESERRKSEAELDDIGSIKSRLQDELKLETEKRLQLQNELQRLAQEKAIVERSKMEADSARKIIADALAKIKEEMQHSEQLRKQVEDRYQYILSQNHAITAEKKRVDVELVALKLKAKKKATEEFAKLGREKLLVAKKLKYVESKAKDLEAERKKAEKVRADAEAHTKKLAAERVKMAQEKIRMAQEELKRAENNA